MITPGTLSQTDSMPVRWTIKMTMAPRALASRIAWSSAASSSPGGVAHDPGLAFGKCDGDALGNPAAQRLRQRRPDRVSPNAGKRMREPVDAVARRREPAPSDST